MPHVYMEPEKLLTHQGVSIYHAYKSGDGNNRMFYWYTTDVCEDEQYQFDVREIYSDLVKQWPTEPLSQLDPEKQEDHKPIITLAIKHEILRLPKDWDLEEG